MFEADVVGQDSAQHRNQAFARSSGSCKGTDVAGRVVTPWTRYAEAEQRMSRRGSGRTKEGGRVGGWG